MRYTKLGTREENTNFGQIAIRFEGNATVRTFNKDTGQLQKTEIVEYNEYWVFERCFSLVEGTWRVCHLEIPPESKKTDVHSE